MGLLKSHMGFHPMLRTNIITNTSIVSKRLHQPVNTRECSEIYFSSDSCSDSQGGRIRNSNIHEKAVLSINLDRLMGRVTARVLPSLLLLLLSVIKSLHNNQLYYEYVMKWLHSATHRLPISVISSLQTHQLAENIAINRSHSICGRWFN